MTLEELEKQIADNKAADLALKDEERRAGRPPEVLAMIKDRRAAKEAGDEASVARLSADIDSMEEMLTAPIRAERAALGRELSVLKALRPMLQPARPLDEVQAELDEAQEEATAAAARVKALAAEMAAAQATEKVKQMTPMEQAVLRTALSISVPGIQSQEASGTAAARGKRK